MRYILLVGLLVVGCGKGEEKATTSSEKTRFTPSELLAMKALPTGVITLTGRIAFAGQTKADARKNKVMVAVEEDVVSTSKHANYIWVVFETDSEFSDTFVRWVKYLDDRQFVSIKGKVFKAGDTIYMNEAEVQ